MSWFENPGIEIFRGLNISDLFVDEAWLTVSLKEDSPPLWLYSVSENCHNCPFQRMSKAPILSTTPFKQAAFKINSQFASRYLLRTDGKSVISDGLNDPWSFCEGELSPGEFGVYELSVASQNNSAHKCAILTLLPPVNIYLPLLICAMFYFTLIMVKRYKNGVMRLISGWYDHYVVSNSLPSENASEGALLRGTSLQSSDANSSSEDVGSGTKARPRAAKKRVRGAKMKVEQQQDSGLVTTTESTSTSGQPSPPIVAGEQLDSRVKERFSSLDAFRGLCIVIMIFADDGGGLYYFFMHCTWDGLYVADLAFPWFLWIMGTCIPFSIQTQISRQTPKPTILKKIIARSVKLILIGLFIINTTSKSKPVQLGSIRVPGVLQRFGICYFVASVLVLYFPTPTNVGEIENQGTYSKLDALKRLTPWIIIFLFIALHTLIIFLLPVPGCPTGYLGPAGLHLNSTYQPHCIGGATGYIDRMVFTNDHIYQWSPAKRVYKSESFDPEGTLGLLTSLLQVWLGVWAGIIFLSVPNPCKRLKQTLLWSLACVTIGLVLCGGPSNAGWIPVNKNLWSLSFVLVTSGLAYLLLSILYFIIDVKRYWNGSPFFEAGMNSILLYIGHELLANSMPWNFSFGRMSTHFSNLVENLWGTSLWVAISVYLYHQRMFLVL